MSPVGRGNFGYKARALEHFAKDSRSGRKGRGTTGSTSPSLQNPIQVSVTKGGSSFRLGDSFKKTNAFVVKAADLLLKLPRKVKTAPYFLKRPPSFSKGNQTKNNLKPTDPSKAKTEDRYTLKTSPSGLVVYPKEGINLLEVARKVRETESGIPNRRIVLNTLNWKNGVIIPDKLKLEFQVLAKKYDITISLKTRNKFYEFLAPSEAAKGRRQGQMVASPSKDSNSLSRKEETELQTIYSKHPEIEIKIKDLDFSPKQEYEILTTLAEKAGEHANQAYGELPFVLEALNKTDGSPEQKFKFLITLAEEAGWAVSDAYEELPFFLEALNKIGGSPGQKFKLLNTLTENAGQFADQAYEELPFFLEILNKIDGSPEQKLKLLNTLAENAGKEPSVVYENLPLVFEALNKIDWSLDQKLNLLTILAKGASIGSSIASEGLPLVFEALNKTDGSPGQKFKLLNTLAEKADKESGYIHHNLPLALEALNKTDGSPGQKFKLLNTLVEKAGGLGGRGHSLAFALIPRLQKYSPSHFKKSLKDFFRILDQLSDYNRESVLTTLTWAHVLLALLGEKNFPHHFALYATLFERWPRLGFNLLEGVMEATDKGIVPSALGGHREKILHFIEQTHGFIPSIYQAYLKEGNALFPKLKKYTRAILEDRLSLKDLQELIHQHGKHGEEFVLGLIQMAAPTSGASFVKKGEQLGLLKKIMETGDHREHIPLPWRGKVESFDLTQGEWKLRKGLKADPDRKILELLAQLRTSDPKDKGEDKKLIGVLKEYLKAGPSPEGLRKIREILYRLAAGNDALREKIDRIQDKDYSTLLLLEQLFSDKDNLYKVLEEALEKVPADLLTAQGKERPINDNPKKLIKKIKKAWSGQVEGQIIHHERRLEILGFILKAYRELDIKAKLLSREGVPDDLNAGIRQVMTLKPDLNKKHIISEILSEPLGLIKNEKARYDYEKTEEVSVGIRPVKGPAFGLHGLCSGVCTVTDLKLWKDPKFKLMAITNEKEGQAVGFIQVYETRVNGKKVLTLVGINPSAEFLGTVNAKTLYGPMMEKVIAFAKTGGYEGIYIPTDANIHSNRSDISKAIQKAGYELKNIPEVKWNHLPEPYPFTEVYVVWEKGAEKKN